MECGGRGWWGLQALFCLPEPVPSMALCAVQGVEFR